MRRSAALILAPASIAVACATVALPAGPSYDGVSRHRVCYADLGATGNRNDSAPARAPAATEKPPAPHADRCGTRPQTETGRS